MRTGQFDTAAPVRIAPGPVRRTPTVRAGWPGAGQVPQLSPGPVIPAWHPAGGSQPPGAAARPGAGQVRLARAGQPLLALQRQYGNRYVQRVVRQARADEAGRRPGPGGAGPAAAGGEIGASLQAAIEARRSGGQRLDPGLGAELGQALGADFRPVRVHADHEADRLSRSLNAEAFTTGGHIFFRADRYRPATPAGQRLLAHELTHVVQQGTGTSPAGRLRLGPASDAHERAADQVAGAMAGGIRAQPPGCAGPAPRSTIQRKVYVRDEQLGQLPAAGDAGAGERSVQAMIADQPGRYFKSTGELYAYARGQTETIGYVNEEKAWVRLDPSELLVLGEHHNATTLPAVTNAVGTNHWMYEQYSELPLWLFTEHNKLAAVTAGRDRIWRELAEKRERGSGHESEGFSAKLWRGLAGIDFGGNPAWALQTVSKPEWGLLESAIFAAAVARTYMPGLYAAYMANRRALERALSLGYEHRMDWPERVSWSAIIRGVVALKKAVAYIADDQMMGHPLYTSFSKGWRPAKQDYGNKFLLAGDRARDLSMYQNILRAADEGYLLYGLGELHGKRLKKLLSKQGATRRISYLAMDEFMNEQRARYPQGPKH